MLFLIDRVDRSENDILNEFPFLSRYKLEKHLLKLDKYEIKYDTIELNSLEEFISLKDEAIWKILIEKVHFYDSSYPFEHRITLMNDFVTFIKEESK